MNAIILAAGLGTRLASSINSIPKPLLPIKNLPIIEYQINYLKEVDVEQITIVVGYSSKKFAYLEEKHKQIELIQNEFYEKYNNFYSMYLARHRLKGKTYVIDGDTFLRKNFLLKEMRQSCYFVGFRKNNQDEWSPEVDEVGRVLNIRVTSSPAFILTGVSYWNPKDAQIIRTLLESYYSSGKKWMTMFWDDIPRLHLDQLDISVKKVGIKDWAEIDSSEDYNDLLQSC